MLRDTSILYELCLDLKEHRYINHDSEEILTESQNKRICQYLDDLVIDLFFRLAKFKPIVITPEICNKRFTDSGLKEINESIELNLNSPFDRYTFLKVLTTPSFIEDKFPGNKFAKLMLSAKRFSCYSHSVLIKPQIYNNPYIDPFYHKYRLIDFDNNRASSLFCFRDFLSKSQYDFGYDIHCPMYLAEILSDYAAIRKVEVFPNISLDYALSIYVILVEKIKLYEDSISSVLAFGLDKEFDISHPLQLFHNFELKLPLLFKTDCIDKRDLYLRFVNRETSKAFSFELNKPFECFTKIRLFKEEPITSVYSYNTLPLPYLYNKLYN